MNQNPFAAQPGFGQPPAQQPPQGPQGWGQPGAPPMAAQPPQAAWGAPPAQPPQASPQGWAPPPQAQAPAQAPAQGYGAPPTGYAPPQGAQGFGPGVAASNPLAGVSEAGGRRPMLPPEPGRFLLECEGNKILRDSNTVTFDFKIIESSNANFAPGMTIQVIQKINGSEGSWEWKIGAGTILGIIRNLMGYQDEPTFRAVAGADDFVVSIVRGTVQPSLVGRRVRCITYCGKPAFDKRDKTRQTGFYTNYEWSVAA